MVHILNGVTLMKSMNDFSFNSSELKVGWNQNISTHSWPVGDEAHIVATCQLENPDSHCHDAEKVQQPRVSRGFLPILFSAL